MSGIFDRLSLDRTARPGGFRRRGDALPSIPTLTKPLAVLAFWSAIALPALYLPLLASGLESLDDLMVFLGLFGLHAATLVLGRSHRPD